MDLPGPEGPVGLLQRSCSSSATTTGSKFTTSSSMTTTSGIYITIGGIITTNSSKYTIIGIKINEKQRQISRFLKSWKFS